MFRVWSACSPGSLEVDAHVAHEVVQEVDLRGVAGAPDVGVELVEGGHVGGPGHVEALGEVVDGVGALQPEHRVLLVGERACRVAAQQVLHKQPALRPAKQVAAVSVEYPVYVCT